MLNAAEAVPWKPTEERQRRMSFRTRSQGSNPCCLCTKRLHWMTGVTWEWRGKHASNVRQRSIMKPEWQICISLTLCGSKLFPEEWGFYSSAWKNACILVMVGNIKWQPHMILHPQTTRKSKNISFLPFNKSFLTIWWKIAIWTLKFIGRTIYCVFVVPSILLEYRSNSTN